MSKANKLLLGIHTFIVVCVVGYALFSENITIKGTATASGSFELTTSCTKGISSVFSSVLDESSYKNNSYENDFCNVEGNDVSFGAKLTQPQALRTFSVEIKNTGTIDAVLNVNTGVNIVEGELYYDTNGDDIADTLVDNNHYSFVGMEMVAKTDKSGNVLVGSEMIDDSWNIVLESGESMHVFVFVEWVGNASDAFLNNRFVEFRGSSISFDFVQQTNN